MTYVKFYTDPSVGSMIDELGRVAEHAWAKPAKESRKAEAAWQPRVDIAETEDHYELNVEAPGLNKDDIAIEFEKGVLKISGERKVSETAKVIRSERLFGRFERVFNVKTFIDAENISAAYKDGILKLTLPKAEEAKAKSIKIK